ncbi:MAG TPA: hypothetical protein VIT88_02905 [Pyrinomonadaceae bacterium]
MQRRTEVTIETERLLVVSQHAESIGLWCHRCARTVLMMTVAEAARTGGTTAEAISRLAEVGQLHFSVAAEGRLFICSNSLITNTESDSSTV